MEQLVKLREAKKVTQLQVANYLGVSRTTYVKYETGSINLPLQNAIKLAEYFGVSVDCLLGVKDNSKATMNLDLFTAAEAKSISETEKQIIESLPELTEEEKAAVNSLIKHYVENRKKENEA